MKIMYWAVIWIFVILAKLFLIKMTYCAQKTVQCELLGSNY